MQTFINLLFLILIIIMGVGTYIGAKNLTKSPNRIYLLNMICGVIIGCLVGYLRGDIGFGLMIGIFIALLFVLGGAVSRWQIKQFTDLEQKRTNKK